MLTLCVLNYRATKSAKTAVFMVFCFPVFHVFLKKHENTKTQVLIVLVLTCCVAKCIKIVFSMENVHNKINVFSNFW